MVKSPFRKPALDVLDPSEDPVDDGPVALRKKTGHGLLESNTFEVDCPIKTYQNI